VLLASGYSAELARGGAAQYRRISKPYGLAQLGRAVAELAAREAA
jgi:hypothetical protein